MVDFAFTCTLLSRVEVEEICAEHVRWQHATEVRLKHSRRRVQAPHDAFDTLQLSHVNQADFVKYDHVRKLNLCEKEQYMRNS